MSTRPVSNLLKQLHFIKEIDRLKSIVRKSKNFSIDRFENSAEHSWHIAVMAIALEEYSCEPIHIDRVLKMLLIHDLVEIDAGDTFLYSAERNDTKQNEERLAARRIFGILPYPQSEEWLVLWEEFETGTTADAKYARAIDRLEPVMQNIHRSPSAWNEHGVKLEQVLAKNKIIGEGVYLVWNHIEEEVKSYFNRVE